MQSIRRRLHEKLAWVASAGSGCGRHICNLHSSIHSVQLFCSAGRNAQSPSEHRQKGQHHSAGRKKPEKWELQELQAYSVSDIPSHGAVDCCPGTVVMAAMLCRWGTLSRACRAGWGCMGCMQVGEMVVDEITLEIPKYLKHRGFLTKSAVSEALSWPR